LNNARREDVALTGEVCLAMRASAVAFRFFEPFGEAQDAAKILLWQDEPHGLRNAGAKVGGHLSRVSARICFSGL